MSDHKPHPLRIQRKRTKGWRLPEGAVCVTRPGRWGNPCPTWTAFRAILDDIIEGRELDMTFDPERRAHMERIAENLEELRGKRLACWCSLSVPCHADVLAEFSNR